LSDVGDSPYTLYSFNAIAAVDNPELAFTFQDDPSYFLLDDVTMIPAPASAAVFSALLFGRRRRRLRSVRRPVT